MNILYQFNYNESTIKAFACVDYNLEECKNLTRDITIIAETEHVRNLIQTDIEQAIYKINNPIPY